MPTDDTRAPHFAMGSFNESSSRQVGEQMVADIVAHFGEKTTELLAAYKAEVSNRTPLTFGDVEEIWEDEIRPKLAEFASLQPPDPAPPADSRWYPNSQIPKGRIL
jgi:hypothetical protein